MELSCSRSCASCGSWFIFCSESNARGSHKLLPVHGVFSANHHIEIIFGWRHGDGSCVIGRTDRQIVIVDLISRWKAIRVPILLPVSFELISETTLLDMIIRLCMCQGWTHHVRLLETKSGRYTANLLDFSLPITVKWENKCYISDKIY